MCYLMAVHHACICMFMRVYDCMDALCSLSVLHVKKDFVTVF